MQGVRGDETERERERREEEEERTGAPQSPLKIIQKERE